jgi:hypothetical protein
MKNKIKNTVCRGFAGESDFQDSLVHQEKKLNKSLGREEAPTEELVCFYRHCLTP